MKVKVLGSVSPFAYEDKKGISFLVTSGNDKVVLDLGEGAISNLSLPDDLENLTIVISHLHRDHICGLLPLSYATLVYKNHGLLKSKIKVYIPADKKSDVKSFVKSLTDDSVFDIIEYNERSVINVGDMQITFRQTVHGPLTFATKIISNNRIFVYSADTGYKHNTLEFFARNADLFICESTFLKDEIKLKDIHLSTIEAANIARNAGVDKLVLAHFWPTHERTNYLNETKFIFQNTYVAKENEEYEV